MNPKGRPKLPEEAKNRMVYARLNPSEMVMLDKLCLKLFVTRSGLLRKALYDTAEKEFGISMTSIERPMYSEADVHETKKEAIERVAAQGKRPVYLDDDDV